MMMRKFRNLVAVAAFVLAGAGVLSPAQAQQNPRANAGGVFNLPQGIESIVSIDAHNVLITQGRDQNNPDQRAYALIVPKHIYSGAIAQLFGGTVIPTEAFLVPGGGQGNARGQQRTGVFPVNNNNPFAGNTGFGGNFNNGYNNGFGATGRPMGATGAPIFGGF